MEQAPDQGAVDAGTGSTLPERTNRLFKTSVIKETIAERLKELDQGYDSMMKDAAEGFNELERDLTEMGKMVRSDHPSSDATPQQYRKTAKAAQRFANELNSRASRQEHYIERGASSLESVPGVVLGAGITAVAFVGSLITSFLSPVTYAAYGFALGRASRANDTLFKESKDWRSTGHTIIGLAAGVPLFLTVSTSLLFFAPPVAAAAILVAFGMTGIGYFAGKHIEPGNFEKTWTPSGRGITWLGSTAVEGRGFVSEEREFA